MGNPTQDEHSAGEPMTHHPRFAIALNFIRHQYVWIAAPLLIGLLGVLLVIACDYATYLNQRLLERYPHASLIILPAGFALIAYLVRRFFRGTQGCGIPQTIAAIDDTKPRKNHLLLSIRILMGKALLLFGGLSIGASIGRDGPFVQIGASIMHIFYGHDVMKSPERRGMLLMAGGAAGIAVAFGAPLAGIMFAIEELGRKRFLKTYGLILLTVVLSCLIVLAWFGSHTHFGATLAFLNDFADAHVVVICGLVGGIMGGIFSRLTLKMMLRPPAILAELIRNRTLLFAAYCGVGVALLGLLTDNLAFGSGYEATRSTLHGNSSSFVWYYGLAKMGATFLSFISGIPGGLFAPSLAVGAGIGDSLSLIFPTLASHGTIVLLVMAAYLSGVTRAPLTSIIITVELTNGFHMLLPLIATALIANAISKLISPTPIYQALAERFS
jgi:H+/Cl- antiporter ClcA